MARVPAIEATLVDIADVMSTRRATRKAIEDGVSRDDIAETIVVFVEDRLQHGDRQNADEYIVNAVHDGISPIVLFDQIKRMVRENG